MSATYLGYGRQTINESDIESVIDCLKGEMLTQGETLKDFEAGVAKYLGVKHVVAVSSGTAALHISALAAGCGPGKLAVTQPMTFVASANCIAYCGGDVGLCEVGEETIMMSPERLQAFLSRYQETEVIIPVSMTGLSSSGLALREVAGPDRIIIEDASHSFGAKRLEDGEKVGAAGYADMTVFSMHPVKPFTTGEGGIVATDRDDLGEKLRLLRNHGLERNNALFVNKDQAKKGWYYEQQTLGYNYRLTDIQAALGLSQLKRIDSFIQSRRDIVARYDELLSDHDLIRPILDHPRQRSSSGHHLYVVSIDFDAVGVSRQEVMKVLHEQNIGTQVHYVPVHQQPYWQSRFVNQGDDFPVSQRYYDTCLSLPCFPNMSNNDVQRVVSALDVVLSGADT